MTLPEAPNDPRAVALAQTIAGVSTRAERQADLVSRIMHARRSSDAVTERLLSAELLASVRPVIKQVVKLTRRHAGSLGADDLEQTAAMAVLRTIEKFDPSRGSQSFGEVAYFRARTACEQYARMHGADVHVSDGAHKRRTSKGPDAERPSVQVESADAPAPDEDRATRASAQAEQEAALRLYSGRSAEHDDPEMLLLAAEHRAELLGAILRLAPQPRELLCRVYGINYTAQSVRSVAELWGAPKSRLDRMLARTLAELRDRLTSARG